MQHCCVYRVVLYICRRIPTTHFRMKNQFIGLNLDFLGFSASMLCAIHCAALPFLLTLAPLAGLQFLDNHWIEYSIILVSLVIASNALAHGYRRHHKNVLPLIIAGMGFMLVGIAQVMHGELLEVLLMTAGGTTIAISHLVNWRYINKSKVECSTC